MIGVGAKIEFETGIPLLAKSNKLSAGLGQSRRDRDIGAGYIDLGQ